MEKMGFSISPFCESLVLHGFRGWWLLRARTRTTDQAAALAATKTITVPAVRSHMRFLSDGLLEGRDTGSRGHEIAAVYVASQLESMGALPAGENGTYFQNVPLRKAINDGSKSSFSLVNRANVIRLKDSVDYLFAADLEHTETDWLKAILDKKGKRPLASKTRGHIKTLMHRIFDCAMLWDYLPPDRNPMSLVRVANGQRFYLS